MRKPHGNNHNLILPAALLLAAGCGGRCILVETEMPWWRQYDQVWEDLLITDSGTVSLVVSHLPAAALAVNPWGTILARGELIDGQTWIKLYRIDSGNIFCAYKLSAESQGTVTMCFLRPDLLWVCDGKDVYSIRPGAEPRRLFAASEILASPTGGRVAAVTPDGGAVEIRDSSSSLVRRLDTAARPLAFSTNGRILMLTGEEEGTLLLLQLEKDTRVTLLLPESMPAEVTDAAFLPDGRSVSVLVHTGFCPVLLYTDLSAADGRMAPVARLSRRSAQADIIGTGKEKGRPCVLLLLRRDVSTEIIRVVPESRETAVLYSLAANATHGLTAE